MLAKAEDADKIDEFFTTYPTHTIDITFTEYNSYDKVLKVLINSWGEHKANIQKLPYSLSLQFGSKKDELWPYLDIKLNPSVIFIHNLTVASIATDMAYTLGSLANSYKGKLLLVAQAKDIPYFSIRRRADKLVPKTDEKGKVRDDKNLERGCCILRLFDPSGPRTGRPCNPHAWSVSTLQRRQCGKSRKGLHYTAESHFICLDSHPFADTTEYYRHAFSPLYT
ncbi:7888_t:CDS:2, partial [Funneliformis caledonium]